MSQIISILSDKITFNNKLIEPLIIKDDSLSFIETKPHKNIIKTIHNNQIMLTYDDLKFYLPLYYILSENNLSQNINMENDWPIVAIYWKLRSDEIDFETIITSNNNDNISYNIITQRHNTNFRYGIYFNCVQSYQHLSKTFDKRNINMYSFALRPESNEFSGVLQINNESYIKIEIETVGDNINLNNLINLTSLTCETIPIYADIIIQYACNKQFNDALMQKYFCRYCDFISFMITLGQSKNIDLLSNNSLKKSFGKLDHYLLANICTFLF